MRKRRAFHPFSNVSSSVASKCQSKYPAIPGVASLHIPIHEAIVVKADRNTPYIRVDDKTASDYALEGGATLHLVLALRGGRYGFVVDLPYIRMMDE